MHLYAAYLVLYIDVDIRSLQQHMCYLGVVRIHTQDQSSVSILTLQVTVNQSCLMVEGISMQKYLLALHLYIDAPAEEEFHNAQSAMLTRDVERRVPSLYGDI